MRIEDYILSKGFKLKPESDTTHTWATELRMASSELLQGKNSTELATVIEFLKEVLTKSRKLEKAPRGSRRTVAVTNGTLELFWIHRIRTRLKETDSPFNIDQPQFQNMYLDGKIQLLEHARANPKSYGERASSFLTAWLAELEAHHDTLLKV